jgi:serine/threonine protein kinase
MPTQQLGNYALHEELGHGGFATVYRATHNTLHNEVALKVLAPALAGDESARQRFLQEAQTASALDHPGIVRILDLDEENEQVFIAMEFIPGGDLKKYLAAHAPLPHKDILRILARVAEVLDYAHARSVLHRDIKPGNILLDGNGQACLCDFGLVRVAETPRLTQLGNVVGTATYISPEQAEGKSLDGRSDQYSLAVVAYEMLVGQVPFKGENSTATALLHVTKPPPDPGSLLPGFPAEASEVLLKGLAKDPAQRYPTCREFVQALDGALEASQRRRYRELLIEARQFLADGKFPEARTGMEAARRILLERPDMPDALAELEAARQAAESYEQVQRDWDLARQKAQDVLELFPDYPDPQGAFVTLGLRKPPRDLRELASQVGFGLLLGLPAVALVWFLAFRWITRVIK